MRQTIREIKANTVYRCFLDVGLHGPVLHFSTFGKNDMRRFKDSDLLEQIFQTILKECMEPQVDLFLYKNQIMFPCAALAHRDARKHSRMGILRICFSCPVRARNRRLNQFFTVEAELSQ